MLATERARPSLRWILVVVALAVLAFVAAIAIQRNIFPFYSGDHDEPVYRFQAEMLRDGRHQHPARAERVLPPVALGSGRRPPGDGVLARLALGPHGRRRPHRIDARRPRRRRRTDRRRRVRVRSRAARLDLARGARHRDRDLVAVHAHAERHLPELRLRARAVPRLRRAARCAACDPSRRRRCCSCSRGSCSVRRSSPGRTTPCCSRCRSPSTSWRPARHDLPKVAKIAGWLALGVAATSRDHDRLQPRDDGQPAQFPVSVAERGLLRVRLGHPEHRARHARS